MTVSQLTNLQIGTDGHFTIATALAKVRSCKAPAFSPDGEEIAFLSDLTGLPQIWVVPINGGWPRLITALDDPIKNFSWSPNGELLAFELAPGGGMNTQIFLIRPDGAGLRCLTDGGRETNRLGPWHIEGDKLSIASNRQYPAHLDTYFVDIHRGDYQQIAKNKGIGYLTDIHADGEFAALFRMEDRTDSNLYLINLRNGKERLLTSHDAPGNFPKAIFSPDPNVIYLISDQGLEFTAFARVNINHDGSPGPIEVLAAQENAELADFELSPDGKLAVLLWNVSGRNELSILDINNCQKINTISDLSGDIVEEIAFSRDGRYIVMSMSGATFQPDIFVTDLLAHQTRQVTFSPHAGVKLDSLICPTLDKFPAHDDLMLSGWFYFPHDYDFPGPMVINFHGGPEALERPGFNYIYQSLLAQGIAIFAPNLRGSSGLGKTFNNLDNGPLREDALRDIQSCVDYVAQNNIASPGQLGIMGASYGGYITLAGLTHYPELFAAGVVISGFANFQTFFAQTEPWIAMISKSKYGHPNNDDQVLHKLSPIHYIERLTAPTLVLHGANDTNVPVNEAEQVVEKLVKMGVPVKYLLFPNEGHDFSQVGTRTQIANMIVALFEKYLHLTES